MISWFKNFWSRTIGFFVFQKNQQRINNFYTDFKKADSNADGVVSESEMTSFLTKLREQIDKPKDTSSSFGLSDLLSMASQCIDFVYSKVQK